jgi:hypothetical protein
VVRVVEEQAEASAPAAQPADIRNEGRLVPFVNDDHVGAVD